MVAVVVVVVEGRLLCEAARDCARALGDAMAASQKSDERAADWIYAFVGGADSSDQMNLKH